MHDDVMLHCIVGLVATAFSLRCIFNDYNCTGNIHDMEDNQNLLRIRKKISGPVFLKILAQSLIPQEKKMV